MINDTTALPTISRRAVLAAAAALPAAAAATPLIGRNVGRSAWAEALTAYMSANAEQKATAERWGQLYDTPGRTDAAMEPIEEELEATYAANDKAFEQLMQCRAPDLHALAKKVEIGIREEALDLYHERILDDVRALAAA